ncbi:MAG: hypothetical protein K9K38_16375 [Rhodoferax sp.]|nr:hypothetical protein [Rhodoferax sp.]MCF8210954.1 hypothetical protein [Rhodoferax sp.]
MQSSSWQTLGKGSILGHLTADVRKASAKVCIVGPWIDKFFADAVVAVLSKNIVLRVVTRPGSGATSSFLPQALASRAIFGSRVNTEIRLLDNLHAKLILIDDRLVYCGSANWYRYSLEESVEVVMRGPANEASGVLDQMQLIWEQSSVEDAKTSKTVNPLASSDGYREEVIDAIAAAKLREVPGSFVIRQSSRRRK